MGAASSWRYQVRCQGVAPVCSCDRKGSSCLLPSQLLHFTDPSTSTLAFALSPARLTRPHPAFGCDERMVTGVDAAREAWQVVENDALAPPR